MTYRDDAPSLRAECERLRAEVAGLRANAEGRTVPPTDDEIDAHALAGGSWIVGVRTVHRPRDAREVREMCERRAALHAESPPGWPPFRWLAFDRVGALCPWPVADGGGR